MLVLAAAPGVLSWSVVSHARPRWVRQRVGDVVMLEAYGECSPCGLLVWLQAAEPLARGADLMPIMDCLKEANQDAVNACFDNISPWLQAWHRTERSSSAQAQPRHPPTRQLRARGRAVAGLGEIGPSSVL